MTSTRLATMAATIPPGDDPATADRLLDGLDETQRLAVISPGAPLAILAGAGSGKTRVLTRRIAWRAATGRDDSRHTLAVTFTRKAAGELGERLRSLGMRDLPTTGTFHSLAYAQLRQRWVERGIAEPRLLDRKIGFIARLLPRRSGPGNLALDATGELEWAAAQGLTPETYPAAVERLERKPPMTVDEMVDLMARYAAEKRNQRIVDFDDLLRLAIRDLRADADYAAAIRWRYRHLYVDEFQDINPVQLALLDAWRGDRSDLTVVGDPNQAIYGWNGADASHLLWFEDRFPGAEVIRLGHNYRSTPQIVAAGHAVLPSNAQNAPVPQAHQPDGDRPEIRSYPTDTAEAAGIARAVRDAHQPGTLWSQQAVLVRTNAQTALIADALRKAQIPTRVRGGASLVDQPEVKDLLNPLASDERPLEHAIVDIREAVESLRPGSDASAADLERQGNREAILRLAVDHAAADPTIAASAFVKWLWASARNDGISADTDAVEITTFHAAKGLEWQIVHLAGLEKGLVPIGYADSAATYAEEKRLLHVAITRAQKALHLSWAEERMFGDRVSKRLRSPYLDALDPSTPSPSHPTAKSAKTAGVKSARSRLHEAALDADDPLYASLAEWRRETAKAADVPAYVVFNNRTLAAIAAARPTTADELLDIAGVGEVKAARYGDDVLDIVEQFG